MLLPDLIRIVQAHADALAAELLDSLRRDPDVPYLHDLGDEELRRRVLDVYRNCAHWAAAADVAGGRLQGRMERGEVERGYAELGRLRRAEGIPASQLVRALHRSKAHLLDFIRRNAATQSSVELYQESELAELIHNFFDSAIEHALRGYEAGAATADTRDRASVAGPPIMVPP
jgi:hypothetical protein